MSSKVLLVVGASSDFGCEFINRYYKEYDLIIAHYNRSRQRLEELQSKIGSTLKLIQADLLDEASTYNMLKNIREKYGVPSYIIHIPASKMEYVKLSNTNWENIQESVDLHVKSAYLILKDFIPDMVKQNLGHIVLILSSCTCDNTPPKYILPYISSKYMLLGMMKSLSADYADKNITINAVSPSMTQTKFIQDVPKVVKKMAIADHPLKRLANVDDVVPMIQFLLSDDAKYITGQNILISGGI